MSELLNYIKLLRHNGVPDYKIVQMATHKLRGGGGISLTKEQIKTVKSRLENIDSSVEGRNELYDDISENTESITLPEKYESYDKVSEQIDIMEQKNSKSTQKISSDQLSGLIEQTETEKNKHMIKTPYEELKPGTIMYHPSEEVKSFSDAMIFTGDIKKVLNREKRQFCMFFTTNEEYAKRYSGLWSLNKRQVYVHKLKVKPGRSLSGIKVFNANSVPDSITNDELASINYGSSENGMINGIKIEQQLDKRTLDEYYICHPEQWFDFVETWMQLDSTRWVKFETIRSIDVPKGEHEDLL